MDKRVKVLINNAFWYLCDTTAGCVCSYRKVGNKPKYRIVPAINAGAVLDIRSEDLDEERQILAFEPIDGSNAVKEATQFAERYEAVHSKS